MAVELYEFFGNGGETMKYCLITFFSRTQASRLVSHARREGYACSLMQTPKALSYGGCTVAVRVLRRDLRAFATIIAKNSISYSRVFVETADERGRKDYEEINM